MRITSDANVRRIGGCRQGLWPAGLILGVTTQYLDNGRPTGFVVLTPGDVAELAAQAAAIKPEDMVEKTAPADLPAKADASAVSAPAKAEAPAAAPPAKP